MKFSGLVENGTCNMPLNFGSDLWPLWKFVFVCLLVCQQGYNSVTQKVTDGFQ